jgi:acetylglutamate kinase
MEIKMCDIAKAINQIRETHRECALIHGAPPQIAEVNMHLAIEAEKYLRRHEARCKECAE